MSTTEDSGERGTQDVIARQRIIKIRRDYNTWVANETMEDYALRFTARAFRKWSEFRVANTAFGALSFLALEAIGGSITVQYGFVNAFWACLATGAVIFLTGLPIAYYAAAYNVDMDLLTRGAGFGYIGSAITSLIYASFTFLFFAIEAAIMALALRLYLDIPITLCYLLSALVVLPLVTHGITFISRLQAWTQPVWLILLVLPYGAVLWRDPGVLQRLASYPGLSGAGGFHVLAFAAAAGIAMSLIAQIGEQVDYLRFMPERTRENRVRWMLGVLIAGPGWIGIGMLKMLGGALLAYVAMHHGVSPKAATEPAQMYLVGFREAFDSPALALAATTLLVVVSQVKINVTNAYAGSLAWSNFFARMTHSHPGRVVWLVFNILIAIMLMELGVFEALVQVLGFYSNIAISWVGAVVADLVINKPLGLSPPGIEFKRAHLHDVNPVGVGAMAAASILSMVAFSGVLGPQAQAWSAFIALATALLATPAIAWLSGSRYYIARPASVTAAPGEAVRCTICEKSYEPEDMASCPAYQGTICSLCCTLDARCHDLCKPEAHVSAQISAAVRRVLPRSISTRLNTRLGQYFTLLLLMALLLAVILSFLYTQEVAALAPMSPATEQALRTMFYKIYAAFLLATGVGCWWLVLTAESRRVAQEESNRQTGLLLQEIEAHQRTDAALQHAKQVAERASLAKSRYVSGISHELRTPLNSILGYAQIVEHDPDTPPRWREAMAVIRRSGTHLVSLIDGLQDISRIETGKLELELEELPLPEFVAQLVDMFRLQAGHKGIEFVFEAQGMVPGVVRTDKKRLGQILINILGNAIKFTEHGRVAFRLRYRRQMAVFEVEDSGIGIEPQDLDRIFLPFERGTNTAGYGSGGTGLGLTIAAMLTTVMGGALTAHPAPGGGSLFRVALCLPKVRDPKPVAAAPAPEVTGYVGRRKRILIVDNEAVDRKMLFSILGVLGFEIAEATSGIQALRMVTDWPPDLILMDVGMPLLDGWETMRLLRANGLSRAPVFMISAGTYDPEQGRRVGLEPHDFLTKPVEVSRLLGRISDRLGLEWIGRASTSLSAIREDSAPPPAAAGPPYPPSSELATLYALGRLGHVRGILDRLDLIEREHSGCRAFTQHLRHHVQQFQIREYTQILERLNRGASAEP